jgi:hypothetical protein
MAERGLELQQLRWNAAHVHHRLIRESLSPPPTSGVFFVQRTHEERSNMLIINETEGWEGKGRRDKSHFRMFVGFADSLWTSSVLLCFQM